MLSSNRCAKSTASVFCGLLFVSVTWSSGSQGPTLEHLQKQLEEEYVAIQRVFANGPGHRTFPPDPHERIRQWQEELSQAFAQAQATAEQILKLHPSDEAAWQEMADTMRLYAQPVSPPQTRTVFGVTEVQKKARLLQTPLAEIPPGSQPAKTKGEVRLRLVLAQDRTVKYIFPMKPLGGGLTEAAIAAAKKIQFEPAIRNGVPVSQFLTLSYEFKRGRSYPPYVPHPEFFF